MYNFRLTLLVIHVTSTPPSVIYNLPHTSSFLKYCQLFGSNFLPIFLLLSQTLLHALKHVSDKKIYYLLF